MRLRLLERFRLVAIATIFVAGVVVGWAFDLRLPAPDAASQVPRAAGTQSIAAAAWVGTNLPPNVRIAADRTNSLPLGSFAGAHTVSGPVDGTNMAPLFLSPSFTGRDIAIVRADRIAYALVDWRLTLGAPPDVGTFYESGESHGQAEGAVPAPDFSKFDNTDISRVYDSGSIEIFDVSQLGSG